MGTRSSKLGAILYGTESTFGETTTTTSVRLDIVGDPDWSPAWPMVDIDILRQRPHEGTQGMLGPKGGTLSFECLLTGLGATSASSAPVSALATLLSNCWGVGSVSHAASYTATGGTAAIPTLSSASGIAAGSLVRIGAKADAGGDGQFVPVSTHGSSNLNLLIAAPAAPANGAQIYCTRMVYESSTVGTYETITGLRFRFLTSRQQYLAHGCYLTGCEWMGLNPGEVPRVKLTFACAWWEEVNATFPDTTSTDDFAGSPVAGGSFAIQDVGTTTRAALSIRGFRWSSTVAPLPQSGPNGNNEYQTLIDCVRGPSSHTFEIDVDAEAAGTNTYGAKFDDDANVRVAQQFIYTMSTTAGRALGLYVRNARWIDQYPAQKAADGVLRTTLKFQAMTGPTTTSDVTLSPWLLAMA